MHFRFGPGLDVLQQGWERNRYADGADALGAFAEGCVQQVTITASNALQAVEHKVRIFCNDPDDQPAGDEERPHTVVVLTVKPDKPAVEHDGDRASTCLLYTSPSPRDLSTSRMPSSA